MKLQEYQEQAKRTYANLGSDKLNLSHMVMGMCTELPELQDSIDNKDDINTGEELADTYWYVSNYETERGYNSSEYVSIKAGSIGINKLYYDIATLQDIVKKYVAYGKEIDTDTERVLLSRIKHNLDNMFISKGLDRGEFLQKNIDKLKARYPEKFTMENAINRNLNIEREILEK